MEPVSSEQAFDVANEKRTLRSRSTPPSCQTTQDEERPETVPVPPLERSGTATRARNGSGEGINTELASEETKPPVEFASIVETQGSFASEASRGRDSTTPPATESDAARLRLPAQRIVRVTAPAVRRKYVRST
jgi:hypothetical protein